MCQMLRFSFDTRIICKVKISCVLVSFLYTIVKRDIFHGTFWKEKKNETFESRRRDY